MKIKNISDVKGDGNINIQEASKSKISIGGKNLFREKIKIGVVLPVVIALIALIVQILIGWEQLIKWFYVK